MIAFDVDGVLADSIHGFNRWALLRFGVHEDELAPFDAYDDYLTRWPRHVQDELAAVFYEVFFHGSHGVYEQADVIPGALEGVLRLREMGLASGYVTRRPSSLNALTRSWLERHGFPELPLEHADGEHPKAPRVRGMGAQVMVEDSPEEAAALAGAGVRVLLRHEPYNAGLAVDGVVRCDGWTRIVQRALALNGTIVAAGVTGGGSARS